MAAGNKCVTGGCTSLGLDCLPVRRSPCPALPSLCLCVCVCVVRCVCACVGLSLMTVLIAHTPATLFRSQRQRPTSLRSSPSPCHPSLSPCHSSVCLGPRQRHPVRLCVGAPQPNPGGSHVCGSVHGTFTPHPLCLGAPVQSKVCICLGAPVQYKVCIAVVDQRRKFAWRRGVRLCAFVRSAYVGLPLRAPPTRSP